MKQNIWNKYFSEKDVYVVPLIQGTPLALLALELTETWVIIYSVFIKLAIISLLVKLSLSPRSLILKQFIEPTFLCHLSVNSCICFALISVLNSPAMILQLFLDINKIEMLWRNQWEHFATQKISLYVKVWA